MRDASNSHLCITVLEEERLLGVVESSFLPGESYEMEIRRGESINVRCLVRPVRLSARLSARPLSILTMFGVSRHIKFDYTQLFLKSVDIIGCDLLINGELFLFFSFLFVISIWTNRARSYVNVSCQTYGRVSLITSVKAHAIC